MLPRDAAWRPCSASGPTNMVQALRDVGGAPIVGGHHATGRQDYCWSLKVQRALLLCGQAGSDVCAGGQG